MRVFLTGGSGFIGGYVLDRLLSNNHQVRCLVRSQKSDLPSAVEQAVGDVTKRESLRGLIDDCDAVIHLVGILEEKPSKGITFEAVHYDGTRHVADEARSARVTHFVHMSANGARADGVSAYQSTKWRAEEYVRGAGFDRWTILRPTVVFGDPGTDNPEFSKQLARTLVKPFPVLPVPGDGLYKMQPIAVEAVAAAFVQALDDPSVAGKSYCAGGREQVTFDEILDRIALALGHDPKPKAHQPMWLVRNMVRAAEKTGMLPISSDQLAMLAEGNTCDSTQFYRDFGVDERPYSPENLAYLRKYA